MQVKEKLRRALDFLKTDIWRIRAGTLPRRRSFLIQQARVILLALRGFHVHKCALRASALTFFSLLSIVPALAMLFGIAKGFGMERVFEQRVREWMVNQPQAADRIIELTNSLLQQTRTGLMALVGLCVLIWTVVMVLGNVEASFNEIWGIRKQRTLARRFIDYLALLIICPVFVAVSGAVGVLVTGSARMLLKAVTILGWLSPLLGLVPIVMGWALFSFLYLFMPNTRVRLRSALVGGVVAGTVYQIIQWAYFSSQIALTQYSAIYGSFAVVPLFLVWVEVTWLVVLFGCELAFAHQNVETYEFEPDCLNASPAFKRLVALRITQLLVRNFEEGRPALTARRIGQEIGAPVRLVNECVFYLVAASVLSETPSRDERDTAYQPARCTDSLGVARVWQALDESGGSDIPLLESEELSRLTDSLEALKKALRESEGDVSLKDI
jgi:membrane protein